MWSRQKRLLREQRGQWGLIRICNPKYWKRISGARVEPAPLSVCASHCPRSDDEPRHAFLEKIDLEAVLLEKPAKLIFGEPVRIELHWLLIRRRPLNENVTALWG